MATKIIKSVGLAGSLTLAIIFVGARCDNEEPFASQLLTFVFPVQIDPIDTLLKVGDTLWISSSLSDTLFEVNTQSKIKLPNFNFGRTSIVLRELKDKSKGLSDQVSAAGNFLIKEDIGKITFPGQTFVEFKYEYDVTLNRYTFRFGFIPTKKGIYCLNFLSPSELFFNGVVDLGKAENGATIVPVYEDLVFPINAESGLNNFELFKENCLDQSQGPEDNYRTNDRYVTFTFRVIE